jgi:hypothetical protein
MKEQLDTNKKPEIGRFWWLVNQKDGIEFLADGDWITGTVKGINLIDESVLIKTPSGCHWQRIYFQLNEKSEIYEKVRIKMTI